MRHVWGACSGPRARHLFEFTVFRSPYCPDVRSRESVTLSWPDVARLPRNGRSGTSLREGDGTNMGAGMARGISIFAGWRRRTLLSLSTHSASPDAPFAERDRRNMGADQWTGIRIFARNHLRVTDSTGPLRLPLSSVCRHTANATRLPEIESAASATPEHRRNISGGSAKRLDHESQHRQQKTSVR